MYDLLGPVRTNTIFSSINLISVYASAKFSAVLWDICKICSTYKNPPNFPLPRAFFADTAFEFCFGCFKKQRSGHGHRHPYPHWNWHRHPQTRIKTWTLYTDNFNGQLTKIQERWKQTTVVVPSSSKYSVSNSTSNDLRSLSGKTSKV